MIDPDNEDSCLWQLQESIADRLRGHALLTGVTVVTQKQGNLLRLIDERLSKHSAAILVMPPVGRIPQPELPGPYFDTVRIELHCTQTPTQGSGKSALAIAEATLRALHHWDPSIDGINVLYASEESDNPEPIADKRYNVFATHFKTSLGLTPDA